MASYRIVLNLSGNAVNRVERLADSLWRANVTAQRLATNLNLVGAAARGIPATPIRVTSVGRPARRVPRLGENTYSTRRPLNERALRTVVGNSVVTNRIASLRNRAEAAAPIPQAIRTYRAQPVPQAINPATIRYAPIVTPPRVTQQAPRTPFIPRAATTATQQEPNYTRHRNTRIASYGYGFNVGGFSGRLSTILQPDANGNIAGLNAESLMRKVNVVAIAGSIMTSIGKALLRVTAATTIAPLLVGGLGIRAAIGALQSEGFAQGVRLISRRHQARQWLGEDYEQAATNADFLSASYGFDRSTTLSSISTLTGLGVGQANRRLTLNEATGLTRVGGLISQQAGVSFERVMTNIQQLLVTTAPNIRDIRELLNQAPGLGGYARREMEARGMQGVDVRTFLKDQSALIAVLRAYELDNASNAGMQARGQIALAQQDMWATIASNNPFWSYVGNAGSGIINAAATGINALLTNLSDNAPFQVMVKQVELFFDNLGTKGVTLIDKLINLVDGLAARYGIDLGDKNEARREVDIDRTIQAAINSNPYIMQSVRERWESSSLPVSQNAETRDQEFRQFLQQTAIPGLLRNDSIRSAVEGEYPLAHISNAPWFSRVSGGASDIISRYNESTITTLNGDTVTRPDRGTYYPPITSRTEPDSQYGRYSLQGDRVLDAISEIIEQTSRVGSIDPNSFPRGGGADGNDLTGMNRDRRALEIHFHDKLVEWNSTITTNSPQEVVSEVADEIEGLTSRAIQIALLGASNKAGSRWN